jgi:hypothetical protein
VCIEMHARGYQFGYQRSRPLPGGTDVSALASHFTCYYCRLEHKKVEAGGIHYCPNPLCTGPGASYVRSKLKSYRDVGNDRHTVDHAEMIAYGLERAAELDATDAPLAAHIRASVPKWEAA